MMSYDEVADPEVEGNDEVEVEAGAIKRKATSAIEKSLPRFKKGNTKLDCPASVASKKVGDISSASHSEVATAARSAALVAALGPTNSIVTSGANCRKSSPETLGGSNGGINKGVVGDTCVLNEGEGSAAKVGGVRLVANSSTVLDKGEESSVETELDAASNSRKSPPPTINNR